jgi:hypothetical protein
MKNRSSRPVPSLSEAERALLGWGVEYKKSPDGTLVVDGPLDISDRDLTRLPDLSSVSVMGLFSCSCNYLKSLEGSPRYVGGNYYCHNNQITSLKGASQEIKFNFQCYNNRLVSLEGAPQYVGGNFSCQGNRLTSLEYAPKVFSKLQSDFGDYNTWSEVPEELRLSPEKRERALNDAARKATILQSPLRLRRPLSFKGRVKS